MSKQQGHVDLAGKDLEFERMQADLRRAQALLEDEIKCAKLIFCICRDITSRKKAEKEREDLIKRLQESLAEIRTLRKILPLCSFCKKVRDDKGYWEQVDVYLHKHSSVDVSHGICPECMKKHYPTSIARSTRKGDFKKRALQAIAWDFLLSVSRSCDAVGR